MEWCKFILVFLFVMSALKFIMKFILVAFYSDRYPRVVTYKVWEDALSVVVSGAWMYIVLQAIHEIH